MTNIHRSISRQWCIIPLQLPKYLFCKDTWRQNLYIPNSDLDL